MTASCITLLESPCYCRTLCPSCVPVLHHVGSFLGEDWPVQSQASVELLLDKKFVVPRLSSKNVRINNRMRSRHSSFWFGSGFKASRGVRAIICIPSLCPIISRSLERILIHSLELKLSGTQQFPLRALEVIIIGTWLPVPSSLSPAEVPPPPPESLGVPSPQWLLVA